MASVTTREEPNNSPIVVIGVIVIAFTMMIVLAFNLFFQPDRSSDLNPVGKRGTRSAAPQSAPAGALPNDAAGTMK